MSERIGTPDQTHVSRVAGQANVPDHSSVEEQAFMAEQTCRATNARVTGAQRTPTGTTGVGTWLTLTSMADASSSDDGSDYTSSGESCQEPVSVQQEPQEFPAVCPARVPQPVSPCLGAFTTPSEGCADCEGGVLEGGVVERSDYEYQPPAPADPPNVPVNPTRSLALLTAAALHTGAATSTTEQAQVPPDADATAEDAPERCCMFFGSQSLASAEGGIAGARLDNAPLPRGSIAVWMRQMARWSAGVDAERPAAVLQRSLSSDSLLEEEGQPSTAWGGHLPAVLPEPTSSPRSDGTAPGPAGWPEGF
mmetsp:Transcript_2529/g.7596  ORF Transcript_2529/g.7596 Transcript_2529/m.7596 type:complete len:308 (-) Transcript_2529:111-1034(-)